MDLNKAIIILGIENECHAYQTYEAITGAEKR